MTTNFYKTRFPNHNLNPMKNLSVICFALVLSLLGACRQDYSQLAGADTAVNQSQVKRVYAQKAKVSEAPIPIEASGLLASSTEANLSFKIGGIIRGIYVKEGQTVYAGQVLAVLDLSEINAQVSKAENSLEKTKRDRQRVENLYKEEAATLEQVQDLETLEEIQAADLTVATFNQRYAQIVAPTQGKILKKMAEVGELTEPGAPIFRLAGTGQRDQIVRVGVSDRDVTRVSLGDTAQISFSAFPGEIFPARISEIAQGADPRTGTFEVELSLNRFFPQLKNGFIARTSIFPGKTQFYIKIPMVALVEGDRKQAQIFISLDQKTVEKHEVPVMSIQGDFFLVQAKALPESWIITSGSAFLKEEDSIEILK